MTKMVTRPSLAFYTLGAFKLLCSRVSQPPCRLEMMQGESLSSSHGADGWMTEAVSEQGIFPGPRLLEGESQALSSVSGSTYHLLNEFISSGQGKEIEGRMEGQKEGRTDRWVLWPLLLKTSKKTFYIGHFLKHVGRIFPKSWVFLVECFPRAD